MGHLEWKGSGEHGAGRVECYRSTGGVLDRLDCADDYADEEVRCPARRSQLTDRRRG